MNIKYLLGFAVIASCLLTSASYASEKKQTESDKKNQSHKSTLQVRGDTGARLPGYLKIGDIKGESTRAPKTVIPNRIEFKKAIAAPEPGNMANRSSKGYIKIGDIKGESTRAPKTVRPTRIEFKSAIAAPDIGDEDNDCDDAKQNATKKQLAKCHRGH